MIPAVLFSALVAIAAAAPLDNSRSSVRRPSAASSGPVHLPLVKARAEPGARLRRRQKGKDGSDLYQTVIGASYRTYVNVGNPPQLIPTIVDTGSTTLVLMSDTCGNKCDVGSLFHPEDSSTFRKTNETLKRVYDDGSTYDGVWASDRVGIANQEIQDYAISLVTESQFEHMPSSSLIGFGWPTDRDEGHDSWPYIMATTYWDDPQFGMFLGRLQGDEDGKQLSEDYNNGVLTLGGVNTDLIEGPIHYAPLIPSKDQAWNIVLEGLRIGDYDVKIGNRNQTALVDSGTTNLVGPKEYLKELFSQIPGYTVDESGQYFAPCNTTNFNVTVTLAGVDWPIYWGDALKPTPNEDGMCQTGFSNSHDLDWILGDTFMRNVYNVFRYDPPSVGFAKVKDEYNRRPDSVLTADKPAPTDDGKATDDTKPQAGSSNSTGSSTGTNTGKVADPTPSATEDKKNNNGATATFVGMTSVLFAVASVFVLTV